MVVVVVVGEMGVVKGDDGSLAVGIVQLEC